MIRIYVATCIILYHYLCSYSLGASPNALTVGESQRIDDQYLVMALTMEDVLTYLLLVKTYEVQE